MSQRLNLFATVLTYAAPSSNYRGESEENRTVLQKITRKNEEYTVISPESMRNALREILAGYELPMNRRRLHDEDQLAVEFKSFPNAEAYADDFLFGYMVADGATMKKEKRPAKRDSVLRMNLAVATSPYRFDATFHQSPLNAGASPWKNATTSALLHREVNHTAYQYPFALSIEDCLKAKEGKAWTKALLRAIGELSNVAGGHARAYFEMAPRSIVARLSPRLVAGFDTYGFDAEGKFAELARIHADDLPGREMWIGGEIVRGMKAEEKERLKKEGARLFENPQVLLEKIGAAAFGEA
ncbi:type I-B CRISPR-associated protein Cas7/Cst2/DevR [Polyangium mundeleinium]|uniref:Type I-B CRISPR-associated protein Cas7/Cst2/DevR n=1 Tax=Polyangium mundeleinium TaxID=2995306 RepID=A0ABT5EDN8_9BACT|nr:type I-B CRISPR-associated protein Cas7/Cst2/DevR [Polyangium mundeleinium]MDC0739937.1 type I-B CRISPR-associated protein Cas7/Cst2/DevR [Polyangium mundeleinium]